MRRPLGRLPSTHRQRQDRKGSMMGPVAEDTQQKLAGISAGDAQFIEDAVGLREAAREVTALDPPPASYAWQVANALEEGATPEDIVGVLFAIAPQVGGPRAIAAAAEVTLALGLSLPAAAE